jgi:hypothetical protein
LLFLWGIAELFLENPRKAQQVFEPFRMSKIRVKHANFRV